MMTHQTISKLKARLQQRLPGLDSHLKMVPFEKRETLNRISRNPEPKKSSVLILLYQTNDTLETLLIKRSEGMSVHGGQISFPGGKRDEADCSAIDTALREANEEIGVSRNIIEIIGTLSPLYLSPSNFEIIPVIGFTTKHFELTPNPAEVDEVIRLPIEVLDRLRNTTDIPVRGLTFYNVPCFSINGHIIWGATAMILQELLDVVQELT